MNTITIPKKRFVELLEAERKLMCLEHGGVDNWDWYGDAMQELESLNESDPVNETTITENS